MSGYRGPFTGDGSASFIGQRQGVWFQLGQPLFEIPLADRLFWLENSSYQPLTGVSPYAATGWNDLWGLRNFLTSGGAPDIIDPSTIWFDGNRRMQFVQANSDSMVGPNPIADYAPFSNGDRATLAVSFLGIDVDPTMMMCATCSSATPVTGIFFRADTQNERVVFGVSNSSGVAHAINIAAPNDIAPFGVAHTAVIEVANNTPGQGDTGVDDFRLWLDGSLRISGELGSNVVFDTGQPQAVMAIGRRGGSNVEFFGGVMWHCIGTRGWYGREIATYLESRRV